MWTSTAATCTIRWVAHVAAEKVVGLKRPRPTAISSLRPSSRARPEIKMVVYTGQDLVVRSYGDTDHYGLVRSR